MKLQIFSDLHLEFGEKIAEEAIENILEAKPDVRIAAGDIGTLATNTVETGIRKLTSDNIPLIYVPGNHEHYRSKYLDSRSFFRTMKEKPSISSFLFGGDNIVEEINGIKFICSTLWFPKTDFSYKKRFFFSDFKYIEDLEYYVFEAHEKSIKFIEENCDINSVVITHHAPAQQSIGNKFMGDPYNIYFVNNFTHLISKLQPKLWVHGHTHNNFDYTIGKTRVVCNPRGYNFNGHIENLSFDPHLIIEI